MIFRRIYVDGFGIWRDLSLDPLESGLNVFMAPNEGGKTTLMSFVRALLFGFKRRGHPQRYDPLRGGSHGGHADIEVDGKQYRIVRSDDGTSAGTLEITGPDGESLPEARLEHLLHNTTESLFENVFAFGLEELQQLETLEGEDIAGHIYSAGMGSGSVTPIAFRNGLQKSMSEIFLPRGRTQPVATLLAEIEGDLEEIERLRQIPEEHADLVRQRDHLQGLLTDHDTTLAQRVGEHDELARSHSAWRDYEKLLESEESLEAAGVDPERVEHLWLLRDDIEEDVDEDVSRIEPATEQTAEEKAEEEAEEEARATRPVAIRAVASAGGGPGPGVVEAGASGTGGAARFGSEEGDGEADESGIEEPEGADRTELEEVLPAQPLEMDPLQLMTPQLRELVGNASRIRNLSGAAERLRDLHRTVVDQRELARRSKHAFFAEVDALGEDWTVEMVRRLPTSVSARDEVRKFAETLHRRQSEVDTAEARAADTNLVYEAISERREQVSRTTAGLTWVVILAAILATATLVPTSVRLVTTATVIAVGLLIGVVVTWLHLRGARQRKQERNFAAQREAELWQHHEDATEHLEEARAEWVAWLAGVGLDETLSPEGTLDLLDQVRAAQDLDRTASERESQVDAAKVELRQGGERVRGVLGQLRRETPEMLYDPMKVVDPLVDEISRVQTELAAAEEERERLRGLLHRYAEARAALRARAGDDGLTAFLERLSDLEPAALSRALGEAVAAVNASQRDRDAVNEQLGAIGERLSRLETDDELDDELRDLEAKRSSLARAVEDWSTYAVAGALFDDAKKNYEAARQPDVVKHASEYLSEMTHGRYRRVIAPLGENRLLVEREHSGERMSPEALSRGTSEQLYLAMRLALAKVYADEAVALPFVADDILVNFDDDRARATAELLGRFADDGHQILAFTCHRHLIDTFERHAPGAHISKLPAHS